MYQSLYYSVSLIDSFFEGAADLDTKREKLHAGTLEIVGSLKLSNMSEGSTIFKYNVKLT